jgi:hypothetical protein
LWYTALHDGGNPIADQVLDTDALKEWGWMATMIAAFCFTMMPRVRLPGNALVKLYLRMRVEEVELSEEFLPA